MFITIVVFILVLSVLVLAHEFGHFWAAKNRGLKPVEFGLGLPSRVWCIYKSTDGTWKRVWGKKEITDAADTIYSINWMLFGGFVNLLEDEAGGDDPNHFVNKKIWERAMILLAGVTMNIFLAMFLYSVGFAFGLPQSLDGLDEKAIVSDRQIIIDQILKDSAASKADLRPSDVILDIDNIEFKSTADLIQYVDLNIDKELDYKIKRGEEVLHKKIIPQKLAETGKGGIGIGISDIGIVRYPWYLAIWNGISFTVILVVKMLTALFIVIKSLIMGNGAGTEVGGPVMIAKYIGQAARMGFGYLINLTALLSVNLAIINALPFPALDGGRVLFLLIEKIKGAPVKRELENAINTIGMVLLLLLMAVVTLKDVLNVFK
jgi:regulator of sigma E protease